MEKTPLYFTPHTQGSLMKHTDSVKGISVVHVAERVLSKILTNKPSTQMKVTIYTTEAVSYTHLTLPTKLEV